MIRQFCFALCALAIIGAGSALLSADTVASVAEPASATASSGALTGKLPFLPPAKSSRQSSPAVQLAKRCAKLGEPCNGRNPACCAGMTCVAGFAEGVPGAWCDVSQ